MDLMAYDGFVNLNHPSLDLYLCERCHGIQHRTCLMLVRCVDDEPHYQRKILKNLFNAGWTEPFSPTRLDDSDGGSKVSSWIAAAPVSSAASEAGCERPQATGPGASSCGKEAPGQATSAEPGEQTAIPSWARELARELLAEPVTNISGYKSPKEPVDDGPSDKQERYVHWLVRRLNLHMGKVCQIIQRMTAAEVSIFIDELAQAYEARLTPRSRAAWKAKVPTQ